MLTGLPHNSTDRQHLCMLAACENTKTSARDMDNPTHSSSELVGDIADVALRMRITVVMSQMQMLTEAVPEAIALAHAVTSVN